tara:strand:+ start:2583 stop:3152 length:570 start_codon:yes stop_codon:yes gene_type:complete
MATGYKNSMTYLGTTTVYYWASTEFDTTIANLLHGQSWDHLRMFMVTTNAQSTNQMGSNFAIEINGDTTASNYFKTFYYTQDGGSTLTHSTGQDNNWWFNGPRYNLTSGTYQSWGGDTLVIGDFYNVNSSSLKTEYKSRQIQADRTANYYSGFTLGIWDNTAAVTSIKIKTTGYFMTGSSLTWYGYNSE